MDLVGRKLLLFSLLPPLDLSFARRILVIEGDWVAHPSNTAARRILVIYSFLVAVSGVGSPKPPGIRMNNFIPCPMIIVFRMNNRSSFVNGHYFSYTFSLHSRKAPANKSASSESFVVSLQARNQFFKPSTEMELIQ
jgi:hypothetical protein